MDDTEFKKLVVRKLEKIEEKHEETHVRLQKSVQDVREEQLRNSLILSQMQKDIPEIKKDLFEHKEGVMQNRASIKALKTEIRSQEEAINSAVYQYKNEVEPVVNHVKAMQALPGKIKSITVFLSKMTAAVALLLGSVGTILAYFMQWL